MSIILFYTAQSVCTRGDDFDDEQISSAPAVSFSHDSVNNGSHSSMDRYLMYLVNC